LQKGLYLTEMHSLKFEENLKGKEVDRQQLNSIKERVWKKQKFTLARRKK